MLQSPSQDYFKLFMYPFSVHLDNEHFDKDQHLFQVSKNKNCS